jgi:hypothetical protein
MEVHKKIGGLHPQWYVSIHPAVVLGFMVLETKFREACILRKYPTTELYLQPANLAFM